MSIWQILDLNEFAKQTKYFLKKADPGSTILRVNVFNFGHPCCFRVALQYEFTKLHLDDVLERLKNHESEELAVQISAYVDNEFDIAVLMEEAEEKVAAMERVADLEDELGRLNETMQELEVDAMAKQVAHSPRILDI